MILIVHNGKTVKEVRTVPANVSLVFRSDQSIIHVLKNVSKSFNRIIKTVAFSKNPDYLLTSLAKHNMPLWLFCYSNPKFLKHVQTKQSIKKYSNYLLFKFVKQHYKFVWMFNLFLCVFIFKHRFPLFSFLRRLFIKSKLYLNPSINKLTKSLLKNKTIDVIIPNIGRKAHLYNVIKDLENQALRSKNVIMVEQNPDKNSVSELDYLTNQNWSFTIKHHFIHKTRACNVGNLALSNVITSEWVLFGDDDNRFKSNFKNVIGFGCTVLTSAYLQTQEISKYLSFSQID